MPESQCPAAESVGGTIRSGPAVVCRIMRDEGVRADSITEGKTPGQLIGSRTDPSIYYGFCCGKALGRTSEQDVGPRAHHSFCPIWEAARERDAARKANPDRVYPPVERPKVFGQDPEVEAELLGIPVEAVIEAHAKVRAGGIAPTTLTGHAAAKDIVENWKEED